MIILKVITTDTQICIENYETRVKFKNFYDDSLSYIQNVLRHFPNHAVVEFMHIEEDGRDYFELKELK